MEQAIQKFQTGEVDVDVFFPTIDYLPKLVAAKLIQPLNHDYIPNLKNVWPEIQDPYYDKGSLYSVPYTIYTPAWRGERTSFRWSRKSWRPAPTPTRSSGTPTTRARWGSTTPTARRSRSGCTATFSIETDLNTSDPAVINAAKDRLIELNDLVEVKTTIDGAYSGVPEGKFGLHQAWSGDIQAGPFYASDPKAEAPLLRYYWPARDGFGGTIDNDTYAIPTNAKNPVLAHLFLNFMMDEFNAIKNWSWLGYQVPFNAVRRRHDLRGELPGPRGLVRLGLQGAPGQHWDNLKSTIVTEEDFDIGKRAIGLPVEVDSLWQNAYAEFKAGA